MSKFLKDGNQFKVYNDKNLDVHTVLPVGTYAVKFNPINGTYFLETIEDFSMPSKLYGDIQKRTSRVLNTFAERPGSTGILLSGEKGSGKTLLAKNIAVAAKYLHNCPALVVNEPHRGSVFNEFIQNIDQPVVIIFDEFEKVYNAEEQTSLLTLLDGVYTTKKLFCFTCNDAWRIGKMMKNRPGRLYYAFDYKGLDMDFIADYCNDNLNDKTQTQAVCRISMLFDAFNFDMLKAMVEEMNRYSETPAKCLEMLNINPENSDNSAFTVTFKVNGEVIPWIDIVDVGKDGSYSTNPLAPVEIEYSSEDGYEVVIFNTDHLMEVNAQNGYFKYANQIANATLELRKVKTVIYDWRAI